MARRASFVLSERIFAQLREDFIGSSVHLPLSVVERAGTGDLVARTTNDIDSLAYIIRFGTDGDLPVVDLRPVEPPPGQAAATPTDSRDRRPAPTSFGAGVAGVRGLVYLLLALPIAFASDAGTVLPSMHRVSPTGAAVVLAILGVLDVGLGLATFFGRNWARLVLMLLSATAVVVAFVGTTSGGPPPTLGAGLPALALSILVLLALSSHRSREYATRQRTPAALSGQPVAPAPRPAEPADDRPPVPRAPRRARRPRR